MVKITFLKYSSKHLRTYELELQKQYFFHINKENYIFTAYKKNFLVFIIYQLSLYRFFERTPIVHTSAASKIFKKYARISFTLPQLLYFITIF